MSGVAAKGDLWSLVSGGGDVDPHDLLRAVEEECRIEDCDFRTRLLIRDSLAVLSDRWGRQKVLKSLAVEIRHRAESILISDLGEMGFPSLRNRIMEHTKPETILQFLRELGNSISQPLRLEIGGSCALILTGHLSRATEDIDIVDEVPREIREQYDLLAGMTTRYGLIIGHFQSHFLPAGWAGRVQPLEHFGSLEARLIDVYDIFLSKLFSLRERDLDDMRVLIRSLDKAVIQQRLLADGRALMAEPKLFKHAERNWYILFGEKLPA